MEKKIPMRMCIVCREMKPKKDLVRIVKSEDKISLDLSGRSAGRGAYICKSEECALKLKKQRSLNKAFSCQVPDEVYDAVAEEICGK